MILRNYCAWGDAREYDPASGSLSPMRLHLDHRAPTNGIFCELECGQGVMAHYRLGDSLWLQLGPRRHQVNAGTTALLSKGIHDDNCRTVLILDGGQPVFGFEYMYAAPTPLPLDFNWSDPEDWDFALWLRNILCHKYRQDILLETWRSEG
jgi:hypothetical protein